MFDRTPLWPRASLIRTLFVLAVLISLFVAGPNTSPVAFTYTVPQAGPPANDNFANAQPILGSSGVINGTNLGATREPNEPNHTNTSGAASVWYTWQAPESGRFVFTTLGSQFDTLLAVYTGNSMPLQGTALAFNDNEDWRCFDSQRESRLAFDAVGGVVYRIVVDRPPSVAGGNITLRWARSASITGRVTGASGTGFGGADQVRLSAGDIPSLCRRTEQTGNVGFTDLLVGGHYIVTPQTPGWFFSQWPTNPSISPLTGDVSDFNFYLSSPTATIGGVVTIPRPDPPLDGLTVTCGPTGPGLIPSRTADLTNTGGPPSGPVSVSFVCSSLPINAQYVITPSKPGFTFVPVNRTHFLGADVFLGVFEGTRAATYIISGRVTHPNGTTGVSGVSVALSGAHTASRVTDVNGNYSFTDVLHSGNYTVTPASTNFTFGPTSRSFNNVTANQTSNFTATFVLQLVLDDLGQAAALDSVLLLRDPFPVINGFNLLHSGVDRNTRVAIFLSNFQLGPGEGPSSVVINLIGSNSQSYDIPAEDVRPASDPTFSRVTFRLPDTLTPGTCTLLVKARGLTSNIGALRIRN